MAEKYYLKLPYAKELKEVPIEEVARIAAMLVREGGLSSEGNNPLLVATAKVRATGNRFLRPTRIDP